MPRPQLNYYKRLLRDILAVTLSTETPLSRHRIAIRVGRKKGDELISRIINTLTRYEIVKEVKESRRGAWRNFPNGWMTSGGT